MDNYVNSFKRCDVEISTPPKNTTSENGEKTITVDTNEKVEFNRKELS